MKRHTLLEPFSRDHQGGLMVARHLRERPGPESVAELLQVWEVEMDDHFLEEEALLSPLAPLDMRERLFREHGEIRSGVETARTGGLSTEQIVSLGDKIHDHIRWEERELFPQLETHEGLSDIAAASEAMELRRHSSPLAGRRAELVKRRSG